MDRSDLAPDTILVLRVGKAPPEIIPPHLDLTTDWFGAPNDCGPYFLEAPEGWRVHRIASDTWQVTPVRIQPGRPAEFQLLTGTAFGDSQAWSRSVTIQLDLETTFDPTVHAFPLRNSARVLGDVLPNPNLFVRTFAGLTGPSGSLLFRGLYSDIVYLTAEGPFRGGLCSGMARWAGLRALHGETVQFAQEAAIDQIAVTHGRQLTDRALLAGLPWLLRGSGRAAYQAIRRDAFEYGETRRALDIQVPKLWRKDIFTAIIREGHTVVPYRIRQESPERAFVDVYDPNLPPNEHPGETQTIEFDLARDRYRYRDRIDLSDTGSGMIAVPHEVYARPGTAILATAGSALWLVGKRIMSWILGKS